MTLYGRFDFDHIARWIQPGERVLDLGCGDGTLLKFLQQGKGIHGYGVELDPDNVTACIRNGVNVLQFDLERGLQGFEDDSFDHVIMSLSLQTVRHTVPLLKEMLRVGHEAVVSFPNFGYQPHREAIAAGRMPVSKHLPYQWYDSPNVRFFTIADFDALCAEQGIQVRELLAFANGQPVAGDPNLKGEVALYRLGRQGAASGG
ncbi:methionine biosynthesis protein MetW [Azovibrio restrictus]|uniref:methionine biosynthesis protein MetW n=1 Tax=Azovibrio restrictus TaxID=146938 RepID=UPI0026EA2B63|nr:methionine biosynthesis protein MetW [Azovibrio restrictus]